MKYHIQEHLYNKELGIRGSCYPTAIACLLDLELNQVPNFQLFYWNDEEKKNMTQSFLNHYCNGNYETAEKYQQDNFDRNKSIAQNHWNNTLIYWLSAKGYRENYIDNDSYKEWLSENVDVPYLVTGKSSRGVDHVVIYMNDKMIHDPHPSGEGLVKLHEYPYKSLIKI